MKAFQRSKHHLLSCWVLKYFFRWKKVGEINGDMWIFPIKSCGPLVVNEFDCGKLGPVNIFRDRTFMLVRASNNEFVTARTYPRMVLIKPEIKNEFILSLSAPGMDDIIIDIEAFKDSKAKITASVWKDKAPVIDCGDEIAKWFSQFLLEKDDGFRLVYYPSENPKPYISKRIKKFPAASGIDTGTLHDETSYMLMNSDSFDDLNKKIEKQVMPLQFRPNFVVKGPKAWEEDSFHWIKIGEQAVFKKLEPCLRCMLTTIDPLTGERNKNEEPIKTLKTFRLFNEIGKSPVFGVHLGLRAAGKVKSGDAVYVSV